MTYDVEQPEKIPNVSQSEKSEAKALFSTIDDITGLQSLFDLVDPENLANRANLFDTLSSPALMGIVFASIGLTTMLFLGTIYSLPPVLVTVIAVAGFSGGLAFGILSQRRSSISAENSVRSEKFELESKKYQLEGASINSSIKEQEAKTSISTVETLKNDLEAQKLKTQIMNERAETEKSIVEFLLHRIENAKNETQVKKEELEATKLEAEKNLQIENARNEAKNESMLRRLMGG